MLLCCCLKEGLQATANESNQDLTGQFTGTCFEPTVQYVQSLDYVKGALLQNLRRRVQQHYACMIYSVLGAQLLAGLPSLAQEMLHIERHD